MSLVFICRNKYVVLVMDWVRILVYREFIWHVLPGINVTLRLFGNNIQVELHLHTNAGFTV